VSASGMTAEWLRVIMAAKLADNWW